MAEHNTLVSKGVGGLISMTVAVTPDGEVRIGNDPHCVMREKRPPLSPLTGLPHLGDLLEEEDLTALAAQIAKIRAEMFGIVTTESVFVEKTSMPRATE